MPFVKLDTNILTSSIWAEDPSTIKVWIYLLASADSNGVVRATVPAIALQCGLDLAMVRAAIDRFCSPDPDSRSAREDGRRIRIERQPKFEIHLLNFAQYRNKDHTAAVRMRNYRQRLTSGESVRSQEQGGRCDCCGVKLEKPYSRHAVQDHNHETGAMRGVVCQSCNKVLGQLEGGRPTHSEKELVCQGYIERWCYVTHVTSDVASTAGYGVLRRQKQSTEAEAETTEAKTKEMPAGAGGSLEEGEQQVLDLQSPEPESKHLNGSEFERWWVFYRERTGRGTDKAEARQAYDRLSNADKAALYERTVKWFEARAVLEAAKEFVPAAPDPKRFIKKRKWEDELSVPPGKGTRAAAMRAGLDDERRQQFKELDEQLTKEGFSG